MNIKAVVPIKLNNERFPNKNLEPLGGKPLCAYLLETLASIPEIKTYIYCSDERIVPYIPANTHFFKRSEKLDQFSVKRQEIVQAMVQDIEADIYVYAHVTNPFLTQATIHAAVDAVSKEDYDSAIGVVPYQKYIWYQNQPMNFDCENLLRTQDIEPIYMEMGLFVFRRDVALKNGSVYGEKRKLIPVPEMEAIDIDYREDLEFANLLLTQSLYRHGR